MIEHREGFVLAHLILFRIAQKELTKSTPVAKIDRIGRCIEKIKPFSQGVFDVPCETTEIE